MKKFLVLAAFLYAAPILAQEVNFFADVANDWLLINRADSYIESPGKDTNIRTRIFRIGLSFAPADISEDWLVRIDGSVKWQSYAQGLPSTIHFAGRVGCGIYAGENSQIEILLLTGGVELTTEGDVLANLSPFILDFPQTSHINLRIGLDFTRVITHDVAPLHPVDRTVAVFLGFSFK